MLTDQQFDRTRRLASRLAGIELADRHRALLGHRSRRLGILDTTGLDLLLDAAEEGESSATQKLLCLLTTKFTGFFRHPRHFELVAEHAIQAVRHRGQARLWSAGTATGEEAWSLAIALVEAFETDAPPVSILATDVDAEAITAALRGEYGPASLKTLTPARRERFLNEMGLSQRRSVKPALRGLVEFRRLNLVGEDWSVQGPVNVVFCRNVLMYLEARHRRAVLERIASLLAPDGLLLLDPTEHLGTAERWFLAGSGGVYSLRRHSGRAEIRCPSPTIMKL